MNDLSIPVKSEVRETIFKITIQALLTHLISVNVDIVVIPIVHLASWQSVQFVIWDKTSFICENHGLFISNNYGSYTLKCSRRKH